MSHQACTRNVEVIPVVNILKSTETSLSVLSFPFYSSPPSPFFPLKKRGVWGDMSPHLGSGAKPQPPNVFLDIIVSFVNAAVDAVFSDAPDLVLGL